MTRARDLASMLHSDGSLNISTSVNLGDNEKAYFGDANDLVIFHNASKSIIEDVGTGNLEVRGTNIEFLDGTGTEYYLTMANNGSVGLYWDGNLKLSTTSTGVDVTGDITATHLKIGTTASPSAGGVRVVTNVAGGSFAQYNDSQTNSGFTLGTVAGSGIFYTHTGAVGSETYTERMRIGSSGFVSIGGSETSVFTGAGEDMKFVVIGDDSATNIVNNSNAGIAIVNTNQTAGNLAGLHFARADTDDNPNYAGASIVAQFPEAQVTGQYPKGLLAFLTSSSANNAPSEKMRIDSSGNVGIGTSSPDLKLHVDGSNGYPAASGSTPVGHIAIRAKNEGSSHGAHIGVGDSPPWGTWIQAQDINNLATSYPLLLNPNGGNVGIGTTNPGELLHLSLPSGTNNDIVRLSRSAGAYSFQLGVSSGSTSNLYISDSSNNKIIDFTSSGNVGIGTNSPARKLTVAGGIESTATSGVAFYATGAGSYNQQNGSSGTAWAYGSVGGNAIPGTASTTFGMHHWNGNSWKNALSIDTAGRVTMPYQPGCLIRHTTLSGVNASSGATLASGFWQAPSGTYFNNGSNFNTSTGRFTAPVSGYYHFTHHIRIDGFGGSYVYTSVLHSSGSLLSRDLRSISTTYQTLHTSGNVYIAANDYIYITLHTTGDSSVNVDGDSFFSCILIG